MKTVVLFVCMLFMHTIAAQASASIHYSSAQLPITVLICSYNNQDWVEKNLDSVFMQKYDNFKVLYIDDCSNDNTASRVEAYSTRHNLSDKITLVCNKTRCRKMKNIYTAIHSCDDHDIIVQLDGDDWFIDPHLFAQINYLYQTQDIWLTYGSDTLGYAQQTRSKIIEDASFRKEKWIYAPTRSFYAWLFKAINLQDFIAQHVHGFQGQFFPSADDVAFMYPMLEMAGPKMRFIPHVNYYVNRENPLNNKKVDYDLQEASSKEIRARTPYEQLSDATIYQAHNYTSMLADILIISDDTTNLKKLLASLTTLVTHADTISIVYTTQHKEHEALACLLPEYQFATCDPQALQETINSMLCVMPHQYVLIAHTNYCITEPIDLADYIELLELTRAHGFYFAYSAEYATSDLQELFDTFYTWHVNSDTEHHMTLLCKEHAYQLPHISDHAVGLCAQHALVKGPSMPCANIPCTYLPQEKKEKKRRLHVPSRDPRTKEKSKSNKSTHKENRS